MFLRKPEKTKSFYHSQENIEKYSYWSMMLSAISVGLGFVRTVLFVILFLLIMDPFGRAFSAEVEKGYLFPLDNPVMVGKKIMCTSWYSKTRTETIRGRQVTYQYKALNYPAKYGEPIRAPFDGVVESTTISGYEGGSITLRANDGITTVRICHMSNFEVLKYTYETDRFTGLKIKVQTRVKRGEIIGYVGSSGRTTGPHIRVVFERNGERFFVNAQTWGMKYDDFYYSQKEFDVAQTQMYMAIASK